MPGDIQKTKLLVVSDSMVYKEKDGSYSAFEPVVREFEGLCEIFDEIIWMGSISKVPKLALSIPKNDKIKIVVLPSTLRSSSFANKLYILLNYPIFIYSILKHIRKAKFIHSRAPSHPAMIAIAFSLFDRKRRYWHKYAGNWAQENPPLGYKLQRKFLKAAHYDNIMVSVNGSWGDKDHVHSFENPCIYESELKEARQNAMEKDYYGDLNMIFVGTIEYPHKGILQILDAIKEGLMPERIKTLYIVGNGKLKDVIEQKISEISSMRVELLGHMNRAQLDEYYRKSHIIILPTIASEGFPKVIAEAASFGCIPVVTGISSLSQYIKDEQHGFIVKSQTPQDIAEALHRLTNTDKYNYINDNLEKMCRLFTYEHYTQRIKDEFLKQA